MIDKITRKIIQNPKFIIILSVVLLIPSLIGFFVTGINYNLLSYLPDDLDSVQGEVLLDENFGCASMAFLIVENMPSDDVNKLKSDILNIDCVSAVLGVEDVIGSGVPLSMLPEEISGMLYSADGSSTMILIQFSTASADKATLKAINTINKVAGKQCFVSGLSAILADTKNIVEKEAVIYILCAILAALVMLAFLSDSWLMPFVILYTLCSAVAYNMGSNIIFGEISYLTECVAVVLQLAVTMDYSIFLLERYKEEKEHCLSKEEAMVVAVKTSINSLLGSSITTIFGFAALCFMSLTLGMDIGIVMIKGVILGLLAVVTVMPAILIHFDGILNRFTHKSVKPDFDKFNRFLINKRGIFAALFVILLIPAYILQSNAEEYYSLDEMLGDDVPSIVALNKLKYDYGMASINFAIVDGDMSDERMNEMLDEVKQVEGINTVLAYNSIVGPAIPESILPDAILSIVRNGGKEMFMIVSEYTAGHEECNLQVDELTRIIKSYDIDSYLTGEAPLTKDLVEIANKDFKVTTVISIAAILIVIAFLLKSYTIPFILVIAIELAIMINNGLSALTGSLIPFIAPAVVGCVQLGATVDYAILLTNRYKQELSNGYNRKEAMRIAANASDYSIFKSVCVFFAATISVYFVCDINLVKDLCLLLSRGALISGTIIIIFLSPILVVFEGIISKTTVGWNDGSVAVEPQPEYLNATDFGTTTPPTDYEFVDAAVVYDTPPVEGPKQSETVKYTKPRFTIDELNDYFFADSVLPDTNNSDSTEGVVHTDEGDISFDVESFVIPHNDNE